MKVSKYTKTTCKTCFLLLVVVCLATFSKTYVYLRFRFSANLFTFSVFVKEMAHIHFDPFVSHSTIHNKHEFGKLPLKVQEMVATKYQVEAFYVEMLGLAAFTIRGKAFLGIEIKLSNIWKLACLKWTRTYLFALRSSARMCLFLARACGVPAVGVRAVDCWQ